MSGRQTHRWFAVHNGFFEHPKTIAAGREAAWLYLSALAYCSRQENDGLIPANMLARVAFDAQMSEAEASRAAMRLIEVGYWEAVDEEDVTRYTMLQGVSGGGYRVHDYADWQETTAEIERRRAGTRERVRKHRAEKKSRSDQQSEAEDVTRYQPVTSRVTNASRNGGVTRIDKDEDVDRDRGKPLSRGGSKKAPKEKPRDELFEAIVETCFTGGLGALTPSARGQANKARGELGAVHASPDDVRAAAERYREKYPELSLTPTALAKHWPDLVGPRVNGTARKDGPAFVAFWAQVREAAQHHANRRREDFAAMPEAVREMVRTVGVKDILANSSTARAQAERYYAGASR